MWINAKMKNKKYNFFLFCTTNGLPTYRNNISNKKKKIKKEEKHDKGRVNRICIYK